MPSFLMAESDSIHIILSEFSIKSAERASRAAKGGKVTAPFYRDVVSKEQGLPDCFNDFFRKSSNKSGLQNFFFHYCLRHYKLSKSLYVAGGEASDPSKCIKREFKEEKVYRASHEEADDRLMFSVNKIYECSFKQITITDAEIFVTQH